MATHLCLLSLLKQNAPQTARHFQYAELLISLIRLLQQSLHHFAIIRV
jgi:hypothetical protein